MKARDERISVVMITHNRGEQICTALEQLLKLPEKPRIIVVDNASTDETVDKICSLENAVELITLSQNLGCAGRNVGAQQTSSMHTQRWD